MLTPIFARRASNTAHVPGVWRGSQGNQPARCHLWALRLPQRNRAREKTTCVCNCVHIAKHPNALSFGRTWRLTLLASPPAPNTVVQLRSRCTTLTTLGTSRVRARGNAPRGGPRRHSRGISRGARARFVVRFFVFLSRVTTQHVNCPQLDLCQKRHGVRLAERSLQEEQIRPPPPPPRVSSSRCILSLCKSASAVVLSEG